MQEEWRVCSEDSRYSVSSWGNVRGPRKLLRPGIASHGYPTVCLGRGNTYSVHVLVAREFIGPCPEGQEVRHIDGTRTNARADNLQYGTRSQNIYDAVANGTWMSPARTAWCANGLTASRKTK